MNKNILIVSSECAPYQKLGGLADANADFSKAYKNFFENDKISIVLPMYGEKHQKKIIYKNGFKIISTGEKFKYCYGIHTANAEIYSVENPINGVPVTYIYSSDYSHEKDIYHGDVFKNSMSFSAALLNYLKKYVKDEDLPNIIHTTDFPVFLKDFNYKKLENIKLLHVIHNAGEDYQCLKNTFPAALCIYNRNDFKPLFKDKDFRKLCHILYKKYNPFKMFTNIETECRYLSQNHTFLGKDKENHQILEILDIACQKLFNPNEIISYIFNPMKKYIETVDYWITDSNTYYKELMEKEYYSGTLYPALIKTKERSCAVMAGIDPERFNPETSKNIEYNFGINDYNDGKHKNKEYLIDNLSKNKLLDRTYDSKLFSYDNPQFFGYLDNIKDSTLIFMSCRLDIFQKGIDIAFDAIAEVLNNNKNIQFIFSTPKSLQNELVQSFTKYLASKKEYCGRYVFIDSYVPIERFFAGSDLFLMPSRFEPCGFSQLISMRFGCIPVVCATGGLNDTITDKFNGFKTQHCYEESSSSEEYIKKLFEAINSITDKSKRNELILNALNYDCSWDKTKVAKYNDIYGKIL